MNTKQSITKLANILITGYVIAAQLAAPLAVQAQSATQRATAPVPATSTARQKTPPLSLAEMRSIFKVLTDRMLVGDEMRDQYRRAYQLATDDYGALLGLTDIWLSQPIFAPKSLADARFPIVPIEDINASFSTLILSYLNMPPNLSEAESQQVQLAFEKAVIAFSLHFQVAAARPDLYPLASSPADSAAADKAVDESEAQAISPPASAGYARAHLRGRDRLQAWHSAGAPDADAQRRSDFVESARTFYASAIAAQASPQAPARVSRIFGSIKVTADYIFEPDQDVEIRGNVVIGIEGADYYKLAGDQDEMWATSGSDYLTGNGKVVSIQTNTELFTGPFTADGNQPKPFIAPHPNAYYWLNKIGDFSIAGRNVVITEARLYNGEVYGSALLNTATSGMTVTARTQYFILSNTGSVSGLISDFPTLVAGSTVTVTGAVLSSARITSTASLISLPAQFGAGIATIGKFELTPTDLILNDGGAGATLTLPEVKFGSGAWLRITDIQATLAKSAQGWTFTASAKLVIDWPPNTSRIDINFSFDTSGHISANIGSLTLTLAGCILTFGGVTLNDAGLTVGASSIKLPNILGGLTIAIQGTVTIGKDGLQVNGKAEIDLPVINIGDGKYVKITGAHAEIALVGGVFVFHVRGALVITLPPNSQQINISFTLDSNGAINSTIDRLSLILAGCTLVILQVNLTQDGLFVDSATLTFPEWMAKSSLRLGKIAITKDGIRINEGAEIDFGDLKFGDGSILSITGIKATLNTSNGVLVFTLRGMFNINLPKSNITPFTITFTLDSTGYISGQVDRLRVAVAGCTLELTQIVLDYLGLSIDTAQITLPQSLGGLSIGVQDVSITRDGLSIGCGVFELPEIRFGSGDQLKITGIRATLTVANGLYIIEARATIVFNLPQNLDRRITFDFIFDSDGNIRGTISSLELNIMSFTLALNGMQVTNQGFYLDQAELRTKAPWPESKIQVSGVRITSSGLTFVQGEIQLPDLIIGSWLKITNIRGRIIAVGESYETTASARLYIKIPGMDPVEPTITLKLDASGRFSFQITNLNLKIAGCTLDIPLTTLDENGLTIPAATLRLPKWLGNTTGTIKNLNIGPNGIKLEGIEIVFPDIDFGTGGMVTLTKNKAALAIKDGVYIFNLTSELNVNVSGNHLGPLNIELYIDSQGEIHAEVKLKELKFTIAGCELVVQDLALGTYGLTLGHGKLTLPKWLGSIQAEVNRIGITKDGLIIEGGITFRFPDIVLGKWMSLRGVNITLTQKPGRIYALTMSSALSVTLPGFAVLIDTQVTVDENGNVSGKLNKPLVIGVAGCILTMKDAQFNNDGLWVRNASFKLPSAWGGKEMTLPYVTITWNNGLAFGVGFDLPDIRLGGALNFVHMVGILKVVIVPAGFAIGISGTLQLRIPDNNQDVGFYAEVSTNGTFAGRIDKLTLDVGIGKIEIVNLNAATDHLYVDSATLVVAGRRIGVRNVVVSYKYPFVDWKWAMATTNGLLPTGAIDLGNGFQIVDGSVLFEPKPDGAYRTILSGNLVFLIGSQIVTATTVITGDSTSGLIGVVGPFTVTVAGLKLVVTGATFQGDRVVIDEAALEAPGAWGGRSAAVYNLDIASGVLNIGTGTFAVPDIQAGGFILGGLRGELLKPGDDYAVDAVGWFGVPDLGGTTECGPMVGTLIQSTPGGAMLEMAPPARAPSTSGLALQDTVVNFNGCDVPIGHTGLSLTGAYGRLALDNGTTQAHITVSIASEMIASQPLGINGQDLAGVLQAAPFKLDLAGAIDVYALFTAAQIRGSIGNGHFIAQLAIDMDGRDGNLVMSRWPGQYGTDQVGSGSMTIDLSRGSLFHECAQAICVDLPTADRQNTLNGEVGRWPDGVWGWQALMPVATGSQATIGTTIDQGGEFDASGLDRLFHLTSNTASQLGQDNVTTLNVTVPLTTDVIFAMARSAGAPGLFLISPDGTRYDPTHLGDKFVYVSTEMTGTAASASGSISASDVFTYNQIMYVGTQVEAGVWQVILTENPIPGPMFRLDVLANDPVPALSQVGAVSTSPRSARVQWALTSNNTDTVLSLYATTGPITHTLVLTGGDGVAVTTTAPAFTGFALAKLIPTPLNGTPASFDVDLSALPSGEYYLWLDADDVRNPPARIYAPVPVTVQATWQDAWDAQLRAITDYRKVVLSWLPSPNPDADTYRLIVQMPDGNAWSRDVGNVTTAMLDNLAPNQSYTLTLEARRQSTGQVARGESVVAVVPGAPFTAQAEPAELFAVSGESAHAALRVTTPLTTYPDIVVITTNDLAGGLGVAPGAQSVVPTPSGASANFDITTAESLPAGVYTLTLLTTGAGESHSVTFTVTVAEPAFRVESELAIVNLTDGAVRFLQVGVVNVIGALKPVELSLDNVPGGLVYEFDPPVIWPGQNSTLIVTDTEPLKSGSYAVQVNGHVGARTAGSLLLLNVTKHPYDITPFDDWQTAEPGTTSVYTLEVSSDRSGQPVWLAVDAAVKDQAGITAGLAAQPDAPPQDAITILAPATVYLIATAAANTMPGAYPLGVIADSYNIHRSTSVILLLPVPTIKYYMPLISKSGF